MRRTTRMLILAAIFLLVFGSRLYFTFQSFYFSDDHSYLILRQVENIIKTGLPMTNDELSYGGRSNLALPLFAYILALPGKLLDPVLAGKIIPNMFASCIVISAYLLVRHLTEDDEAALISAFISGFLPTFFAQTANSISSLCLMLPLMIMLAYLLLTLEQPNRLHLFLLLLCVSSLLSASIMIFVLAMVIHLVFLWVEGIRPNRAQAELTLFSLFLVMWFFALYYKDALLLHGPGIVWQNIPQEVFGQYFSDLTLSQILSSIGVIPLICGVLVIFTYTFLKREKDMFLLIALVLILTLLLLLQWIELSLGLAYLGAALTILASKFYVQGFGYLTKTKFALYKYPILAIVLLLLASTAIYPAFSQAQSEVTKTTNNDHVRALEMLSNISEQDALIVATVLEGHSINYFAKRKNMVDTDFIGIPDAEGRLDDVRTIFTSAIETKPVEIMAKYGADYIYFTDITKAYYNITRIAYADGECFPLFYSGRGVTVYKRKC